MKTISTLSALLCSISFLPAAPKADAPVNYEANLAKVPATDPDPATPPAIVPALKGQHPRLLFTKAEIEDLRKRVAADPLLKKTAERLIAWAKRAKPPKEKPPAIVTSDTPALASSVGQYAGLAYAYGLDPDPVIRQNIIDLLTVLLDEPYWADVKELDSSMGAGNNLFMAGLLFDAVAADLEPDFRSKFANKLLTQARRMYYLGHQKRAVDTIKYWQQDPQNNHRWHRDAGMTASLFAIADMEGIEAGYMLEQLKQEMDFLMKWYPADGDCHEGSGYQRFGFFYLAMAARIWDRVAGTEYLKNPGFQNAWAQQLYYWIPANGGSLSFGDDMNTPTLFNHLDAAFFICPSLSRDKNVQAALKRRFDKTSVRKDDRPYDYPWSLLAFYDPTVGEGDATAVPKNKLFGDLGAATMRDSWEDGAVLFGFKCGPYGGFKLNEYRHEVREENGDPHYINVAHDDPDANSFALSLGPDFIFHPGVYSTTKLTEQNNTLTVDGKGQIKEGDAYTQPVPKTDMRELSYLTGWKEGPGGSAIIEGEAGAAYPSLKQFRRTAIWMPDEYILLLDNIQADGKHEITWRAAAQKAQFENPADGRCYAYTNSGARLDFQMLSNRDFKGAIDYLYLHGRFGASLLQQFQFSLDAEAAKFACLLDPWKKKPSLQLREEGGTVTLTVKMGDKEDIWTWQNPADGKTPSVITGKRGGQVLAELTAKDKAPIH
jgi:hypothetical protein